MSFGLLVLAGVGALAECAARTWGEVEKPPTLFDDPELRVRNRPFVVPDDELGFRLKPGFAQTDLNIDGEGFRVTPAIAAPVAATLLTLGDSTTFGWSVGDLDTYPSQLASTLHRSTPDRHVRVINGGVPSYTSAQVARYVRVLTQRMNPDAIVLSVLWNDLWFSTVQTWFPELLVFARPSPWREYLNEHSALFRWAVQARRSTTPTVDAPNEPAREAYVANVVQAVRLALRSGSKVYFLVPPFDESRVGPTGVDPFRQNALSRQALIERARRWTADVAKAVEAEGAVVVDHDISLLRPARHDLFVDLIHPNRAGYALMAAAVEQAVSASYGSP